jgi:hypothetical protein
MMSVRHRDNRICSPMAIFISPKTKGRQIAPPPFGLEAKNYFRLVIAVRSAESLTIPVAPHHLEPTPLGLIGVKLPSNLAV